MKNSEKSGFATASLVLGIIGICTSFIPIVNNVSFILALIAILFAIVSLVKKASKGKAIAGVIISILTIAIVINVQKGLSEGLKSVSDDLNKATGNSTEEVLANDVDVQIGNFEAVDAGYGLIDTKLSVSVKNKKNETKSFTIQIEAVDSNGSRIANDYIYANNLTAGQSQNFDIFTLVSSDKVEQMKSATYKVVECSVF